MIVFWNNIWDNRFIATNLYVQCAWYKFDSISYGQKQPLTHWTKNDVLRRISLVYVSESAVSCRFCSSHLLKKSLTENFVFSVVRPKCSIEWLFWNILQNSQDNTSLFVPVSFAILQAFETGIFLQLLRDFLEQCQRLRNTDPKKQPFSYIVRNSCF